MNFALVWTEPAYCDLERIDRYLRSRNPSAAAKFGKALLKQVTILKTHPEIGRVYEPDLPHRVLSRKGYRIYYRGLRDQRVVEISHVRHGARSNPTIDDLLTD